MSTADNYINRFYERYGGRVAIGVGYNPDLSEIYPLVFKNQAAESIGIVALGATLDERRTVYIYHLGAFEPRNGDGTCILRELCDQADKFGVSLKASAIVTPNGKDDDMTTGQLVEWYRGFGFKGNVGLFRKPVQ